MLVSYIVSRVSDINLIISIMFYIIHGLCVFRLPICFVMITNIFLSVAIIRIRIFAQWLKIMTVFAIIWTYLKLANPSICTKHLIHKLCLSSKPNPLQHLWYTTYFFRSDFSLRHTCAKFYISLLSNWFSHLFVMCVIRRFTGLYSRRMLSLTYC